MAACPPTATQIPENMDARAATLHQLDARATECSQDAPWHAQRGAVLLALGREAEAAESLERALLLDPNHAGARVDYADALARLGDTRAATELAASLLTLPDLPGAARRHLEQGMSTWGQEQSSRPSPWQTRVELTPQIGWERNLNGGPATDAILLTLPEGTISLPLARAQRPQAGAANQTSADLQALRTLSSDWSLFTRGQLRLRDSAGAQSDYLLSNVETYLLHRRNSGELSLQLSRLDQLFGGKHLLSETRLVAQHLWLGEVCRPRLGIDGGRRDYPGAAILDGDQFGIHLGLLCARGAWRLDTDLRLAEDTPRHAGRPGGSQEWMELQISAVWQAEGYRVKSDVGISQIRDDEGYSPLLSYNETRRIRRQSLRLEFIKPLTPRWDATVSAEHFRQQSNLRLFELNNHGLYFGARYHY